MLGCTVLGGSWCLNVLCFMWIMVLECTMFWVGHGAWMDYVLGGSVGIATDTIMLLAHNKQLLLVYA